MQQMWLAHRTVDEIARWPLVRSILRARYDRLFEANRTANLFRGVYDTFEEARRAAPAHLPIGYDHPGAAAMYRERMTTVYAHDYPVMFWLQKLLAQGCTDLFDLGGHVGIRYYAFAPYVDLPEPVRWVVYDVPAVVEAGRQMALERGLESRLSFSTRFDDLEGAGVLIALGSIHYLPETLADRLKRVKAPPAHLIFNGVPVHSRYSYFTLQSIGTAFCPYRIAAMPEFMASFEALGYRLVDRWDNPDKRCTIPFHPDRSLDRYFGFYFRRAS
jgi:putative methyltransferase (TIGR04325 family)